MHSLVLSFFRCDLGIFLYQQVGSRPRIMKISKGIPDDSAENSVKAIKEILKEEAELLGAKYDCRTDHEGAQISVLINIGDEKSGKSFWMRLTYTEPPTYGNGTISGRWDLRLIQDEGTTDESPPFRWGLYPWGTDTLDASPVDILDGLRLRKLLREVLGFLEGH